MPDGHLPHDYRLGRAFCSLLEHLDPRRLPLHGGDATTMLVTVDLATLRAGLAGAALPGGGEADTRISAGEARRLACTAQIVPLVLGGDSEVLDVGRGRRLYTRAQRKAMAVRDRRCHRRT